MMNSISAMNVNQPAYGLDGASLTNDQKKVISETLSKFDADNLSQDDAVSIISSFEEAGIRPGKELAEVMEDAGFNARGVGEKAGVKGPPPGQGMMQVQGDSNGYNLNEEVLQSLYTLLDQYYAEDTTDEERSTLMESVGELLGSEQSIFSASA